MGPTGTIDLTETANTQNKMLHQKVAFYDRVASPKANMRWICGHAASCDRPLRIADPCRTRLGLGVTARTPKKVATEKNRPPNHSRLANAESIYRCLISLAAAAMRIARSGRSRFSIAHLESNGQIPSGFLLAQSRWKLVNMFEVAGGEIARLLKLRGLCDKTFYLLHSCSFWRGVFDEAGSEQAFRSFVQDTILHARQKTS